MSKAGKANRKDGVGRVRVTLSIDERLKAVLERDAERCGVTLSARVEGLLMSVARTSGAGECRVCGMTLNGAVKNACRRTECGVVL